MLMDPVIWCQAVIGESNARGAPKTVGFTRNGGRQDPYSSGRPETGRHLSK